MTRKSFSADLTHLPIWIGLGSSLHSPYKEQQLQQSLTSLLSAQLLISDLELDVRALNLYYLFLNPKIKCVEKEDLIKWHRLFNIPMEHFQHISNFSQIKSKAPFPTVKEDHGEAQLEFYIYPRNGMVSSWSAKCTDIIKNIGFPWIQQVEHGELYHLLIHSASVPSYAILEKTTSHQRVMSLIKAMLHDKMLTEIHSSLPIPQLASYYSKENERIHPKASPIPDIRKANTEYGLNLSLAEISYLESKFMSTNPYCSISQNESQYGRYITDVELYMFAQMNSEHCRHKIFRSSWKVGDDTTLLPSLFDYIKATHARAPGNVVSAYTDNAAVLDGPIMRRHSYTHGVYSFDNSEAERLYHVLKVETHNHPTGVCPYPGAATGAGGEIRDEGAVGQGSIPKAALVGFSTSDLRLPSSLNIWEALDMDEPKCLASPLEIMLHAPLGASNYNNEFGRPLVSGYWRTLTTIRHGSEPQEEKYYGYHKPIMLSGGFGHVRPCHALKPQMLKEGEYGIVVLGGPSYRIGLGGGSSSSQNLGTQSQEVDEASVQRDNAELQRRAQEVILACTTRTNGNPIMSIHDVGAGGLANAVPELLADIRNISTHVMIDLRAILTGDPTLSPLEIWANESQERYVLLVEDLKVFERISRREKCPFSVIGHVKTLQYADDQKKENAGAPEQPKLQVWDSIHEEFVINMELRALFPSIPLTRSLLPLKEKKNCFSSREKKKKERLENPDDYLKMYMRIPDTYRYISELLPHLLRLPCVGSKSFLVTINDRSISGLVVREPMIGPWQVPISDIGVTLSSYPSLTREHGIGAYDGEGLAIGERPLIAITNPVASGRMAVGEALLNLLASGGALKQPFHENVVLSANWMASLDSNSPGENDRSLVETVQTTCESLLKDLGLCIPVGKDSLFMSVSWKGKSQQQPVKKTVSAPLTLVVTAFGILDDIRYVLSPQWIPSESQSQPHLIILVSLNSNKMRLGGSCFAQVIGALSEIDDWSTPTFDYPHEMKKLSRIIHRATQEAMILAYHDVSDGGLLVALIEMAIAGHVGCEIRLPQRLGNEKELLLNEELAVILEIPSNRYHDLMALFKYENYPLDWVHLLGSVNEHGKKNTTDSITIQFGEMEILKMSWKDAYRCWAETSHQVRMLRENPATAMEEFESVVLHPPFQGLGYHRVNVAAYPRTLECLYQTMSLFHQKPKVAILREQGINGHVEMAYAFNTVGFQVLDLTLTDLLSGSASLDTVMGLAAPGGFSYGDCLGAGRGWASTILLSEKLRTVFEKFFSRKETFVLGVCNGCQMLSYLTELFPGFKKDSALQLWPVWEKNKSEVFESRFVQGLVSHNTTSIFFDGMKGWTIPVPVAHGEGKATLPPQGVTKRGQEDDDLFILERNGMIPLYYTQFEKVDASNELGPISTTIKYPYNPNGSLGSIAGINSPDGRITLLMPHPERVILESSMTWKSTMTTDALWSPWIKMFLNARLWLYNTFVI